jgi:hypothetical protein
VLDILAGHQHGRRRQARGFKTTQGEPARRRRHDGPSIGRKRSEKVRSARYRFYASHILDFGKKDRLNLDVGIDTRQTKPGDDIDAAHAVNARKKRGDVETVAFSLSGPYAFGRRDRTDDRAVHVEQQRAEGALEEGALAHDGVGTAKVALKQLGGNPERAAPRNQGTWRSVQ